MQALHELFSSDVGLMSLAVIGITLGMGVFYTVYFLRHVKDGVRSEQQAHR